MRVSVPSTVSTPSPSRTTPSTSTSSLTCVSTPSTPRKNTRLTSRSRPSCDQTAPCALVVSRISARGNTYSAGTDPLQLCGQALGIGDRQVAGEVPANVGGRTPLDEAAPVQEWLRIGWTDRHHGVGQIAAEDGIRQGLRCRICGVTHNANLRRALATEVERAQQVADGQAGTFHQAARTAEGGHCPGEVAILPGQRVEA